MGIKEENKSKVKDKYYWLILVGGIGLILVAPWVFTRSAFWEWFDFSSTGTIGDTIGGITAPIVGTLGAVLVYLSFREQRQANKDQSEALQKEIKRNEKQNKFEFLYKFYIEEIRDYKFPLNYTLKECFEAIKVDMNNLSEKDYHQFFERRVKVINNYLHLNTYFMRKLISDDIDESNRLALINIYLINYSRFYNYVNMPKDSSRNHVYLTENFKELYGLHTEWNKIMDNLIKIFAKELNSSIE